MIEPIGIRRLFRLRVFAGLLLFRTAFLIRLWGFGLNFLLLDRELPFHLER